MAVVSTLRCLTDDKPTAASVVAQGSWSSLVNVFPFIRLLQCMTAAAARATQAP
jgi:hypothetical protein